MNTAYQELQTALDSYFAAVAAQRQPQPPDLLSCFRQLDELESRCSKDIDPLLRHFLKNKSYEKARDFLRGIAPPRGSC
jgi:hypothetical protein